MDQGAICIDCVKTRGRESIIRKEWRLVTQLPYWVNAEIHKFAAPSTGKVKIDLEIYDNRVTRLEIGGIVRVKPEGAREVITGKTPGIQEK